MALIRIEREDLPSVYAVIGDLLDFDAEDLDRAKISSELDGVAYSCVCGKIGTDRGNFEDTVQAASNHIDQCDGHTGG